MRTDDHKSKKDKLQENINMTVENMRRADDMIEETSDDKMREALIAKNERREQSLQGLRSEIREEACSENKK